MGTNYYFYEKDTNHCDHCGRCDKGKIIHIGKSSAGWRFIFYGTSKIRSWNDWWRHLNATPGNIIDEYGRWLSLQEFVKIVRRKKYEKNRWEDHLPKNDPQAWLDLEGHPFWGIEFS